VSDFRLPAWIRYDRDEAERCTNAFRSFARSLQVEETKDALERYLGPDALGKVRLPHARPNTEIAYTRDQRRYVAAALVAGLNPLAPIVPFWTEYFIEYASSHSVTTMYRHAYGIANLFHQHGLPSPTRTWRHKRLLRRLAREAGVVTRHAKPLYGDNATALLRSYDTANNIRNIRDYTICVIGFTRGFRSATIVGLFIEDIKFELQGVVTGLRNEKTSRNASITFTGTPHTKTHEFCMPCGLKRMVDVMTSLGIDEGPLFRGIDRWGRLAPQGLHPKAVTDILRGGLRRANIANPEKYSSHSFRHGVVIAGKLKNWTVEEIMTVTMHRSIAGIAPYLDLGPWAGAPANSALDEQFAATTADCGWRHR